MHSLISLIQFIADSTSEANLIYHGHIRSYGKIEPGSFFLDIVSRMRSAFDGREPFEGAGEFEHCMREIIDAIEGYLVSTGVEGIKFVNEQFVLNMDGEASLKAHVLAYAGPRLAALIEEAVRGESDWDQWRRDLKNR